MKLDELKKTIWEAEEIVLSIDLDNTLVNRDKGANYVPAKTLKFLRDLKCKENLRLLINTGREYYGFESFRREVLDFDNAIIGSGSVLLANGEYYYDSASTIDKRIIKELLRFVNENKVNFLDISYFLGRELLHSKFPVRELFLSQNPGEWFIKKPEMKSISNSELPGNIYRIEFPIAKSDNLELYAELQNKKNNCFEELVKGFEETDDSWVGDYVLKRKAYFRDDFKDRYAFARLEKTEKLINKGTGIINWLKYSRIEGNPLVVHIGDRDHGIVDDTIIKVDYPNSIILMVGNRFDKDNPLVDCYFEGNIDENVNKIIKLFK